MNVFGLFKKDKDAKTQMKKETVDSVESKKAEPEFDNDRDDESRYHDEYMEEVCDAIMGLP